MKKIFSLFLIAVIILMCFTACGKSEALNPVSGEITEKDGRYTVSFAVENRTEKEIKELSAVINTYTDGGKKLCEKITASYPIEVQGGARATLTFVTDKKCSEARLISYSYKTENGKTFSGNFSQKTTAYVKEKSSDKIATREELADKIIRDYRGRFLAGGSFSAGDYDSDKKRLTVVSRFEKDYDTCVALYEKEPEFWDAVKEGIISMSQTSLEEFQSNNFDDVTVSIGVISSDEKVIFMAVNGELTLTPDSGEKIV